jgi:transposase IS4-like protein
MALLRDLPITEAARQLELALPDVDGSRTVASSTLTQARTRLGEDPMKWLFLRSSEGWANASADRDRWQGLALYAVDGTTLRVADGDENRAYFGGHDSGRHDGGRAPRFRRDRSGPRAGPGVMRPVQSQGGSPGQILVFFRVLHRSTPMVDEDPRHPTRRRSSSRASC